jgi:nucleoside-diphosphate-sugar epimerase
MQKYSKIYLAGNKGLVGSAIARRLEAGGYENVATSDIADFDLTDPKATDALPLSLGISKTLNGRVFRCSIPSCYECTTRSAATNE